MKRTILGAALLLALVSPALAAHHARKAPAAHGPVAIGKSKLSPGVAAKVRPHISFKAGGAANCNPNFVTGQVPSASLWNAAIGCAYPTAGGQLGGAVTTPASTTAQAPLNIPPGTGPTAPNNGDIWADGTGIFYQSGGATVGPLGTGGGSGPDVNVIQWAGQPVGAPTSLGVAPSSGLFPTINAQILNSTFAISNTSFGISGTLPAFASTPTFNIGALGGAATAVNQATIAGNQTSGGQKSQVVDSSGNSLGTSGHPFLIACADGSTTCTGSGGGGGGGGGSSGSSVQGTKSAPINISTATTTRLITGQSGQFTYVTGWDVAANGSGAIKMVYGTTSSTPCDTGQTDLTGNYSWTAQTGINKVAVGIALVAPVGTDVCAVTSAAISYPGSIQYTQSATPLSSFGGGGSGGASSPYLTAGTYLDVASVGSSAANSVYPAGAGGVAVWNYGAVAMAVKLSSSGTPTGTFATSDAIIQPGSCAQLLTTGFTNVNYYTQSSTTSMHMVGVTSGTLISCGGGGSSSSGGANIGVNGATAPGSSALIQSVDGSGNGQAVSATNPLPVTGNVIQADTSIPISISSATTTLLVALTTGKGINITSWDVVAGGTGTILLEYGTGTTCVGTHPLTGAYPLVAQAGISKANGIGPVLFVPASNALCAVTSAGVQMSGSLSYKVQ